MPSGACNEIVDDIEDLLLSQDIDPNRTSRKGVVTVRVKKSKLRKEQAEARRFVRDTEEITDIPHAPRSIVPGTQKIFIKTWGCTHNSSDSEYMAGLLASYGYTLTKERLEADLWLLNSCTVKSPAEDHFRNEIEAAKKAGVPVVATGCVPQGAPKSGFLHGLSIIGVQQIDRVVEVVEQTLNGNTVRLLGTKKSGGKKLGGAPLTLPKIRRNPLVEIIAINTGCLNQCTYCKTKHARGELGSYPPEEIIARAVEAFSEGVVELWLTSEDTGAYGRDIGTSLPELLKGLVAVIPEGAMMRVGMTNPPYILDHLESGEDIYPLKIAKAAFGQMTTRIDTAIFKQSQGPKEMAQILSHPRVYSFLHCPVQSGSDCVLGDMKREYTRSDFEKVVDYLNANVADGISIATDVICGFPTETEKDFEETMSLVAKYKFPSLFINQFFPRPGTPAATLPRIDPKKVKERTKRITEFFLSYDCYEHLVGTIQTVLVTETAYDGVSLVGHTKRYEQVLLPGDKTLMGKIVTVKIVSAAKYSMKGVPVSGCVITSPSNILSLQKESEHKLIFTRSISIIFLVMFLRVLWILF